MLQLECVLCMTLQLHELLDTPQLSSTIIVRTQRAEIAVPLRLQ